MLSKNEGTRFLQSNRLRYHIDHILFSIASILYSLTKKKTPAFQFRRIRNLLNKR